MRWEDRYRDFGTSPVKNAYFKLTFGEEKNDQTPSKKHADKKDKRRKDIPDSSSQP